MLNRSILTFGAQHKRRDTLFVTLCSPTKRNCGASHEVMRSSHVSMERNEVSVNLPRSFGRRSGMNCQLGVVVSGRKGVQVDS